VWWLIRTLPLLQAFVLAALVLLRLVLQQTPETQQRSTRAAYGHGASTG
jgi:hypothetical protein